MIALNEEWHIYKARTRKTAVLFVESSHFFCNLAIVSRPLSKNSIKEKFDIAVDNKQIDDVCMFLRQYKRGMLEIDTQAPKDNSSVWLLINICTKLQFRDEFEFTYAELLRMFGVKRLLDVNDRS